MNQKEQGRLKVLNSLWAEQMTVDQAAGLMGVSTRHTRRVLAAYQREGAVALAHGHRGRRPVPRQLYLPIWRQSVLPVHLLGLAPLLGCIGPVAGDVKLQDDGVVHHPVNRRGGGHGVGKDAFPLREDQV